MSNTKQQIEDILDKFLQGYTDAMKQESIEPYTNTLSTAIEAIDRLVTEAYKNGFNAGSVKETLRHGAALKVAMDKLTQTKTISQLNDKEEK